jgi:hypothetical protein
MTRSRLSIAREQPSQQLTSIKCSTLASSKYSWSLELLTIVPSTKGWRDQFGRRSWLLRPQRRGNLTVRPNLLDLLFWSYAPNELAESRIHDTFPRILAGCNIFLRKGTE